MITTRESFWQELSEAGLVSGSIPPPTTSSPWYIRVMLGISGWIAAIFLLGFVAIGLEFIIKEETVSIAAGLFFAAIAFILFLKSGNDFLEQFALALSLTGQALILYGLWKMFDWKGSAPWMGAAVMQALITTVMPNAVQRMVAAYLSALCLSVALTILGSPFIVPVLVSLGIALLWLNEYNWSRHGTVLRPVAYGLTFSLIQLKGQLLFENGLGLFLGHIYEKRIFIPQWFAEFTMGLLFVAVVYLLLARRGEEWNSKRMLTALLVALAVVAVSLKAPGIATGLMIILLGFANGNRILLGIGIASLLFYISAFYYTLQATLLTKSEILAATGAVLLLARWVVSNWLFETTEKKDG